MQRKLASFIKLHTISLYYIVCVTLLYPRVCFALTTFKFYTCSSLKLLRTSCQSKIAKSSQIWQVKLLQQQLFLQTVAMLSDFYYQIVLIIYSGSSISQCYSSLIPQFYTFSSFCPRIRSYATELIRSLIPHYLDHNLAILHLIWYATPKD